MAATLSSCEIARAAKMPKTLDAYANAELDVKRHDVDQKRCLKWRRAMREQATNVGHRKNKINAQGLVKVPQQTQADSLNAQYQLALLQSASCLATYACAARLFLALQ
jgi:hypothetical protein